MASPAIEDYRSVNREGWSRLARQGNDSSRSIGDYELANAREWLDYDHLIPWGEVRSVLCLACGGGQQAPMFASLGYNVVCADLCPQQLEIDRQTAQRHGLEIECVEADMLDLSVLYGRDFDLAYQAISSCYIPDIRRLYVEISRVLRPYGFYRVEHWSPISMQLGDDGWTGRGYELTRPCISGYMYKWTGADEAQDGPVECLHYIHSLGDMVGGLCEAGFHIHGYSERPTADLKQTPGSEAHMSAYVRPFFTLYARRSS
jgi:SAM-dependent methyltransferase